MLEIFIYRDYTWKFFIEKIEFREQLMDAGGYGGST